MPLGIWFSGPQLFQFHKGTIRTSGRVMMLHFVMYFNSIKVRLEPHFTIIIKDRILFQFHKGTIRTSIFVNQNNYYVSFQFHKGTIRTLFWFSRF